MAEQKLNGVSSVDEFRNAALSDRMKRAEAVNLPSGLTARLVKATPWEVLVITGMLPQRVAAAITPEQSSSQLSPKEALMAFQAITNLIQFIFVSPAIPGEAQPGIDIPFSDIEFAVSWARGEVTGDGQDLATFRPKQAGSAGIALA